jgi:hypothetical protein
VIATASSSGPAKQEEDHRRDRSGRERRRTERQGTLTRSTRLSEQTVARIGKGLEHGCSVEATSNIDKGRFESIEERCSPTIHEPSSIHFLVQHSL